MSYGGLRGSVAGIALAVSVFCEVVETILQDGLIEATQWSTFSRAADRRALPISDSIVAPRPTWSVGP